MQDMEIPLPVHFKDCPLEEFEFTGALTQFPLQILDLADSLHELNLSSTGLSSLPAAICQLRLLKIAFFSDCKFEEFPVELAECRHLEMVAFRRNGMRTIPESALPLGLRWLILTDNHIGRLPATIGKCGQLQKCMLAGNMIKELPVEMAACRKLALLRLSANKLEAVPDWLLELPELAFLSLAGNPCCPDRRQVRPVEVAWEEVQVLGEQGQGASGVILRANWRDRPVAVKLFKGGVTSDGLPIDELTACLVAGKHENLVDTLGQIYGHPDKAGLAMQQIPEEYRVLGSPPSMQSCTRDCFELGVGLTGQQGSRILQCIAGAAMHLHSKGVAHGDLYAHNIYIKKDGQAILGDMGAATVYGSWERNDDGRAADLGIKLEKIDVLAFAHLIEDVGGLVRPNDPDYTWLAAFQWLAVHCSDAMPGNRPSFATILTIVWEVMASLDAEEKAGNYSPLRYGSP